MSNQLINPYNNNENPNSLRGSTNKDIGTNDNTELLQKIGIVRITLKKNNVFMNVTDVKGHTIIKFSSGLVQKNAKQNKKKLFSLVKFILNKISIFVKNNFDAIKIIIKGRGHKSFSFLKELKKKKLQSKIIYFENKLPLVHNGCRPPKKRRL
jgi:ribosomal protein S11